MLPWCNRPGTIAMRMAGRREQRPHAAIGWLADEAVEDKGMRGERRLAPAWCDRILASLESMARQAVGSFPVGRCCLAQDVGRKVGHIRLSAWWQTVAAR
ncbi:hypothetical protein VPH35_012225 [Triticum aestivum]